MNPRNWSFNPFAKNSNQSYEQIRRWNVTPYDDQKGNNFQSAGATYNGGVIFQSPLHQTNNYAVDVAAQDPEVPSQTKGKGKGKLTYNKWTNEEQWDNAVTQFCAFACYSRPQNIELNIESTTIHSQLPSEKLPGNCLVIVVDLEPRPVWFWKFPKVRVMSAFPASPSSTVFNHEKNCLVSKKLIP